MASLNTIASLAMLDFSARHTFYPAGASGYFAIEDVECYGRSIKGWL
jgi:hypothetical protein